MSLAAGMGSVVTKNSPLYSASCTEYLAAVKHCNGTDFWVMGHEFGTAKFRAHQVSAAGVNTVAVISTIGAVHGGSISPGCMKFSPNGKMLGIALAQNIPNVSSFEVYDFDPSTGVLSNSLVLSTKFPIAYGCEFSPDGSKFYGAQGQVQQTSLNKILQWDLCAATNSAIVASEFTVAAPGTAPLTMQMAANGKIYVAKLNQQSLGVINNPNALGASCNYVDGAQSIGTATCYFGLPNFISSFFRGPVITGQLPAFSESISCNGVTFSLPPLISGCRATGPSISTYTWNFGDPGSGASNTSTVSNPVHTYNVAGSYTVQLLVLNNCLNDTIKKVLTVGAGAPTLNAVPAYTICKGASATLTVSGAVTYSWTNNATGSVTIVTPTATSIYTVSGTISTSSCLGQKSITVTVNPCLGIDSQNGSGGEFTIFPNPTKGILNFETNGPVKVLIYNTTGILEFEGFYQKGKHLIDIGKLSNGIYTITSVGNASTNTARIIKTD